MVIFFMGLYSATEVAYMTYIYAKVSKDKYQRETSRVRSAMLFGRCTGAILAQFFMLYEVMDAQELIYFSLGGEFPLLSMVFLGHELFL